MTKLETAEKKFAAAKLRSIQTGSAASFRAEERARNLVIDIKAGRK